MKIIDVIFALICGKIAGFLVSDLLKEFGVSVNFYESIIIWLAFPLLALLGLWLCYCIGRKILFIFQAAKFFLVGAAATVIDLKIFEVLGWVLASFISVNPAFIKAFSFIISTALKYWGNKYWTFQKHEKEDMRREIIQFFIITAVGVIIDVSAFYYATQIMGPHYMLSVAIWTKLSIVFAALAAALWNFLGYKFLVFKK